MPNDRSEGNTVLKIDKDYLLQASTKGRVFTDTSDKDLKGEPLPKGIEKEKIKELAKSSDKPLSKDKVKSNLIKKEFRYTSDRRTSQDLAQKRSSSMLFGSEHTEKTTTGSSLLGIDRTKDISTNNKTAFKSNLLSFSDRKDNNIRQIGTKESMINNDTGSTSKGSMLLFGQKGSPKSNLADSKTSRGFIGTDKKDNKSNNSRNSKNNDTGKAVIKAKALTDLSRSIASSGENPEEAVKSFGINTGKKAVRKALRTVAMLVMKVIMTVVSLFTKIILAVLPGIIFALLPIIIVVVVISSIINLFSGGSSNKASSKYGFDFKEEYLSEDPIINDVLNYAKALCDDQRHGYTLSVDGQGQCTAIDDYNKPDLCCAQFVSICYHNCGADLRVTAGATTLYRYLRDNEDFIEVTRFVNLSTEEGLLPGDIFLVSYTEPGVYDHTEIYYGKGKSAGAHNDRGSSTRSPRPGDQGDEVSICGYYYDDPSFVEVKLFRYIGSSKNATTENTTEEATEETSE